jgi:tetratricopeptide (TPR) repeat protein
VAIELLRRAEQATSPGEAREALAGAVLAANDRIWVHRNAARIYRERFDDRKAARGVLEQLEPLTCSEWRLTAAAWVEVGDRDRADACLERAAHNARTPADLCTLAMGFREAAFDDEARLLIEGADAIATRALDCWTVANAYDSFEQRADALAVLERGLRDATDATEIATFAHALATYDADAETIATTLAKGERRAATVDGWLVLARAWDQLVFDRRAALRCVAGASKLSVSSDHERAIGVTRARVTQLDLLDDERPRVTPGQLLRPGARTFGWDRDAGRLLGWLRSRIPRTSIDALTQPDQFFINDGLRTLLEIQRAGVFPHPLPAYLENLREVARGAGPGEDPLTRAFAATLVCIDNAAAAAPYDHAGLFCILLGACTELGEHAVEAAIALFGALADAYDAAYSTTTATYHTLFAELAMVCAAAWLDPTDPRVDGTIARLVRDEPRRRARAGGGTHPAWLLGLAPGGGAGIEAWRIALSDLLVHPRQQVLRDLLGVESG